MKWPDRRRGVATVKCAPVAKYGRDARLRRKHKESDMSADTINNIPALAGGRTAVITGGASGIGLATAKRLAGRSMNIVVADRAGAALEAAGKAVAEAA